MTKLILAIFAFAVLAVVGLVAFVMMRNHFVSAARMSLCVSRLSHIGVAADAYYCKHGSLPFDDECSAEKSAQSWRFKLLPYYDDDAFVRDYNCNVGYSEEPNATLLSKSTSIARKYQWHGYTTDNTTANYYGISESRKIRPSALMGVADAADNEYVIVLTITTIAHHWLERDCFLYDSSIERIREMFGTEGGILTNYGRIITRTRHGTVDILKVRGWSYTPK